MAKLKPEFIEPPELSEETVAHLVEIGTRQAELIDRMEAALGANDVATVLALGRQICGLEKEAGANAA